MIRFSVVICLSVLLFSTSAKPYRPRERVFKADNAVQDTIVSFDEKMFLGMKEVEPKEDMDITDFDIDPDMMVWKAAKDEILQKYNRPEEDKDALYHPFDMKHPVDPEIYVQPQGYDRVLKYDKPEEDRDDLYHGRFNVAKEPIRREKDVIGGNNVRPIYSSPEEDKDDLYHAKVRGQPSDQEAQPIYFLPIRPKRVHTEPEVDLDDVYHKQ
ncbi:uncharacterized protein isoform X1 [Danio rerio]|uniref:Uncharacterized protein isoform X1 n=1 Tax=Danio rerio TaxID=7955 RepID=A0A8M3B847_DANRE|nr:uncharacterized protein LOC368914 isoform X1 [Danio rerio]|eukprot:XP_009305664.1 uncharacterized protein LOC368914 isoform X1 [Danio rerio]